MDLRCRHIEQNGEDTGLMVWKHSKQLQIIHLSGKNGIKFTIDELKQILNEMEEPGDVS